MIDDIYKISTRFAYVGRVHKTFYILTPWREEFCMLSIELKWEVIVGLCVFTNQELE